MSDNTVGIENEEQKKSQDVIVDPVTENVTIQSDNNCAALPSSEISPSNTTSQTNQSCTRSNSDDEFHSADEGEDTDSDEDVISQQCNVDNVVNDDSVNTWGPHVSGDDSGGECEDREDVDREPSEASESDTEAKEANELEARKRIEESLTAEELEDKRLKGQQLKDEGNIKFRSGALDEAIDLYTEAMKSCPLNCQKERSIMYSNRAACYLKKEDYDTAIKDSCSALDLNPTYMKALLRRAELYEKTDKLDEALKDFKQILELDPGQHMARAKCLRLAEQINERNEKMKEEMMGKLKDLGNMVLRPFGLSTNNFKMQQDPATGGYSMQFVQSPGNGS